MPAKWQQWMPFKIDAFKGSPAVQAMHPAARSGYLYLLASAWQTEDCTLRNDAFTLAELSGLGDELWALYSERILRKFEPVNGDRSVIRNLSCFEEWEKAKHIFEARQKSAKNTTKVRKPRKKQFSNLFDDEPVNGDRTVTDGGPSRSAHTRTGTITETNKEPELTLLSPLAPPEPKLRPEEFANTWNRLRGNLPKVDKFTEGRRRKVVTRMNSGLTLEHFAKAVENCRVKPFLYGDNDRGWTATFDWLIANGTNLEKAIEQPYGLNKNGGSNGNGKTAGNREAALEVIAEYANNNGSGGGQLVPVRESRQGLPEAFHGTTIEGKP